MILLLITPSGNIALADDNLLGRVNVLAWTVGIFEEGSLLRNHFLT